MRGSRAPLLLFWLIWLLPGRCQTEPKGGEPESSLDIDEGLGTDNSTNEARIGELFGGEIGGKVQGGVPVGLPDRFPYVVSLQTPLAPLHFCSGVLVKPKWVLTAGHCVGRESPFANPPPLAYIGGIERVPSPTAEVIETLNVIVHPNFTGTQGDGFDLALLELKKASEKKPIRLPKPKLPCCANLTLVLLGWGRTVPGGPFASVLQKAQMPYVTVDTCRGVLPEVDQKVVCAGGYGAGVCVGDGGAPLVKYEGGENDLVVGIASLFTEDCATLGRPSLFTRVSLARRWIKSVIA